MKSEDWSLLAKKLERERLKDHSIQTQDILVALRDVAYGMMADTQPVERRYQHVGIDPQFTPNGDGFALLMVGKGGCGSKTPAATAVIKSAGPRNEVWCDGCHDFAAVQQFVWENTKDILKPEDFA